MMGFFRLVARGIRKPPRIILARVVAEISSELEAFTAPLSRKMNFTPILRMTNCKTIDELWQKLADRPYPTRVTAVNLQEYERLLPGDAARIFAAADLAMAHRVNLLGSGLVYLGKSINWHIDPKTGRVWENQFFRRIDYVNLEAASDVKLPWEISRLQWLMPVGQAYLLTQDENYAQEVKDIISDWIDNNPYAGSVNWTCTMEVAIRIVVFTWFFHVFKHNKTWQDEKFKSKFLISLYLHSVFTEKHIERSDINGNHFTADAAGLVFSGLFWGVDNGSKLSKRWFDLGWMELNREIQLQVGNDGCDFEGSIAYHRLVAELFFYPAYFIQKTGGSVGESYLKRLEAMADFTRAYIQPCGETPLLGDADDARLLPFGGQDITNHDYLPNLLSLLIKSDCNKLNAEIFWSSSIVSLVQSKNRKNHAENLSVAFRDSGYYIMKSEMDHIFIDCAPIGLAGRGGHGHNDALSFEAVLNGCKIISDCGAYLYTASYKERNLFRSTESHNCLQIDSLEINRFIREDYLWNLHNDAKAELLDWQVQEKQAIFIGMHHGYSAYGLLVNRVIALDLTCHGMIIYDYLTNSAKSTLSTDHFSKIKIPLHFNDSVNLVELTEDYGVIAVENFKFLVNWQPNLKIKPKKLACRISKSYGTFVPSFKLVWEFELNSNAKLENFSFWITIKPIVSEFNLLPEQVEMKVKSLNSQQN